MQAALGWGARCSIPWRTEDATESWGLKEKTYFRCSPAWWWLYFLYPFGLEQGDILQSNPVFPEKCQFWSVDLFSKFLSAFVNC